MIKTPILSGLANIDYLRHIGDDRVSNINGNDIKKSLIKDIVIRKGIRSVSLQCVKDVIVTTNSIRILYYRSLDEFIAPKKSSHIKALVSCKGYI